MHGAPRTSLLLSQPLKSLFLGHAHSVSEDGKWVRGLLLWLREAHLQASTHSYPHVANGQSAHQPAQQQQQQQQQQRRRWPTVRALEFINNSRQNPHKPFEPKINPWRTKNEILIIYNSWCHKVIKDLRYVRNKSPMRLLRSTQIVCKVLIS
jgi:hypothetical protein